MKTRAVFSNLPLLSKHRSTRYSISVNVFVKILNKSVISKSGLELYSNSPLLPSKSRGEPPSVPLPNGAVRSPLTSSTFGMDLTCVAFVSVNVKSI